MELVEQERFPGGLEFVGGIGKAVEARYRGEGLSFEEAVLAGPVQCLHFGLGRECASVKLQVELADPDR